MKDKNWIQKAVKPENKGKLHKKLGVALDKKIPAAKLEKASKAKGALGKEARLAKTLKKMNKGKK